MVAFRAAVRGEAVRNVIQRVRSGDATPRWLSLSATPLWVSGSRTGAVISLTDITQRKQAELELVELKERLEDTLGSITEGYYALDASWRFVVANRVAELHFGKSAGALSGQNIWTLTGTPPDATLRVRFEAARASGRPAHFDAESHVRAGYWAEMHLYPRGDLLDVYFSDASERKQAEAALQQAVTQLGAERDRLAVTLRSIGDAVIATDESGRVELFNAVAEQLTGWRAEEARGKPIDDIFNIVDEESRQPAVSPVGRVLSEGVVLGLANHTALVARDGSECPIADSAAPIRDASGRVTGVVLVFRDQTEERRAERALRQSEAWLRLLAEALPQLVWTADDGGSIDYFNARWRDYTGQVSGAEDWEPVLHPDDRERVLAHWHVAVAEQREFEVEHRLRRADGEYRWYLRRALLLGGGQGARGRWFGTCTDIHDLKLSQDALRQADRLKEDFLSMASHEFRTPLTALRLQAELLRQRTVKFGPPDERLVRQLAVMDRQIDHMEGLLGTLLDVSRINAGKLTLDLAPMDLAELAAEVVERFRSEAGEAGTEVRARLRLVLGAWDRTRLDQVITNLVGNAIKYGNRRPVEVEVDDQDGAAVLIVRDRGIGIEPESVPRLFERFERGTNTAGFRGLGLGLWIAKKMVEAHREQIVVESVSNAGSTFTVTLPRAPPGQEVRSTSIDSR